MRYEDLPVVVWFFRAMVSRVPPDVSACPLEHAIAMIGGKWKPLILFHLFEGAHRFGELRRKMPCATQQMLTAHLREMEADGLVARTVYPQIPPRVDYSLTDQGERLRPVCEAMVAWAEAHLASQGRAIAPPRGQAPPATDALLPASTQA